MHDDDAEMMDAAVTECPECEGTGETPDGLACTNPDAFWTEDDSTHIVFADDLEDEEDEAIVETGPETGGHDPVTGSTAREGSDAEVAEPSAESIANGWPEDKIGVVVVGQNDGLAHKVTRALGSDGEYLQVHADMVAEWQRHNTPDEPEGVVVGKTWAMVLPELKVGDVGWPVYQLCKALGVPAQRELDQNLMIEAIMSANPEAFDSIGPDEEVPKWICNYTFGTVDWLAVL